ncbi:MAG: preprotein translocase subunit SecG [Burkholderiales bacterium]|nr:preprotein translocase subunit SecG [Burkholderiales bacterium]
MMTVVLLLQIVSALAMIGLVLVQHGKGADMGASFGSGASGSLFGATGSANFLSRSTAVAATVFFSSTLMLAYFGNHRAGTAVEESSLLEKAPVSASAASAAVAPASAAASGAALIPVK